MKLITDVIDMLSKGETLPEKYKNHPLKGELKGYYDCHVLPDLVLIYKIEKERLVLILFDIETHSNLF
jgi:mRNA interferase YafQ